LDLKASDWLFKSTPHEKKLEIPMLAGLNQAKIVVWLTVVFCSLNLAAACGEGPLADNTPITASPSPALLISGQARPVSRSDSLVLVREVARHFALALQDESVRDQFAMGLKLSRVREGKLHLQRYLASGGTWLSRAIELRAGLPVGALGRALANLTDLEVYLPVPTHRGSWKGTPDILVAGLLERDADLRRPGFTFPAYDLNGIERQLRGSTPPVQPVLVLVPAESEFDAIGEGPRNPELSGMGFLTECTPEMIVCDGDPSGGGSICAKTPSGRRLMICRVDIPNVGQYEQWPNGSPEISVHMFSTLLDGSNYINVGCVNEDLSGAFYYNQDNDTWTGYAEVGDSAYINSLNQGGREVGALVWEDDWGSKCTFTNTDPSVKHLIQVLTQASFMAGLHTLTGCEPPSGNSCEWWQHLAWPVFSILHWIGTADDDLVGAAVVPSGSAAGTVEWSIRQPSETNARGTIKVVTRP
jgi:hypothetical protein